MICKSKKRYCVMRYGQERRADGGGEEGFGCDCVIINGKQRDALGEARGAGGIGTGEVEINVKSRSSIINN